MKTFESEFRDLLFQAPSNEGKQVFCVFLMMIVLDMRFHVIISIIFMITKLAFEELFSVVYESDVSRKLPFVCKNFSTLVTYRVFYDWEH